MAGLGETMTYAKFNLRRIEVKEGAKAMLEKAGWTWIGPAGKEDTTLGNYWVNPRSKMKYTQRVAVDLEELRESLNTRSYGEEKPPKTGSNHLVTRPRINFSEPKPRNRQK